MNEAQPPIGSNQRAVAKPYRRPAMAVIFVQKVYARLWRLIFGDVRLIWEYPLDAISDLTDPGDSFGRFDRFADIPKSLLEQLNTEFGLHFAEEAEQRMKANARLYVMLRERRPVAVTWIRRGRNIPRWFVPLRPTDVVSFGVVTARDLRGQHIRERLLPHVLRSELAEGMTAYLTDCSKVNRPAIRTLERRGYRFVTEARTMVPTG